MEENTPTNQEINNKNTGQKQIAGAIIIAGLIIAGAVLLKGNSSSSPSGAPQNPDAPKPETSKIRPVSKDEHILGNPNAKVIIVEYSDTECPFCKRFHSTMHTLLNENNNVAWVYRHYPIPQLHEKAFKEAEATECAWEQGGNNAFWKYTDELYARTESNDALLASELPKIAEFAGLNVTSFKECLSSGKYKAKVQSDIDNGNLIGVRGTPASFILKNGKVVDTINGALPYEQVKQKVDAALK